MTPEKELALERVQGQTRLAVFEDGRLCEMYYERGDRGKLAGNIYAGRVENILPGMNAAFVDIGLRKNAFLQAGDIGIELRDQQGLREKLGGARIEKTLRAGQMIVVQVVKEPGGDKGPRISGNLSLPGRTMVLLPQIEYAGVSKKIVDPAERDRLHAIAKALSRGSGAGVIVRTAAENLPEEQLRAEFERLLLESKWICEQGSHCAKPMLLQADGDLALRMARDLLDGDVARVRVDDARLYDRLCECVRRFAPEMLSRVELYRGETPLFDLLRADHQLESAFARRVHLKSGGNLVIDETEALTVIDVNTAKFTGKRDPQETILRMNCEAADEIARQLRLRDLGGIIVVDFIDMRSAESKEALLSHLREALKRDANRTSVLGMTALGLVEMTRKKARMPLKKLLMRDCARCLGYGAEWTHESTAYRVARELWRRRRMGDTTAYRVEVCAGAADRLRAIGMDGEVEIIESAQERDFVLTPAAEAGLGEREENYD